MVAVLNDSHAALITRSLAAGALRHFILSEVTPKQGASVSWPAERHQRRHHRGIAAWGANPLRPCCQGL